jgi:hypothetical protein
MQPPPILKKIFDYFSALLSENKGSRPFILLSILLLVVLLVSFIIPQLFFGRFYGSDAYSHLRATNIMASSKGISEFYSTMAYMTYDPSDPSLAFNYPFGMHLFGATIAKITGIPPMTSDLFFMIIFLLILVSSFYIYSGIWLDSREQKICAVLFLLSMPYISLIIMDYVPSVFVLPFLFATLYFIFKEPVDWKLFPFAVVSIFIIIISHAGTFVFLFGFSLAFFILYCLFWGKFSKTLFTAIISILCIYVSSLELFPLIAVQYAGTYIKLLLPGNFLRDTFNFALPGEVVRVFYDNILTNHQIAYVVILAAILYIGGNLLVYIHRRTKQILIHKNTFPAFVMPIQNLSHSTFMTPIWIGPFQTIFSVFGFFHLDNKGKCFFLTALLVTLSTDLLQVAEGISVRTGALRQIGFLMIIIPITATLGFWHILDYLQDPQLKINTQISSVLWVVVCLGMILVPTLAMTYYVPTLSGENYVIGGVKWLDANGDHSENVAGYNLRPLTMYSNMTTAEAALTSGSDSTRYLQDLRKFYFMPILQNDVIQDLRDTFGVKYIISSDRILRSFYGTTSNLTTDSIPTVNKIYASNDFGIYELSRSYENPIPELNNTDTVAIEYHSGNYEITSDYYKITLGASTPVLKRFGPPDNDYLNYGYLREIFTISGTGLVQGEDRFKIEDLEFNTDIKDNQITYTTVLKNPQTQTPEGTLVIRYTFYPDVIKREYALSNDWIVAQSSPQINVGYSLNSYSLLREFVVQNDKTRLERKTVVYEDSVTKPMNIENFYLHKGDEGMYITFAGISPQPSSISYSGSVNNRSSIVITQSNPVKPGASFLSTQFVSVGSEDIAKRKIQSRNGINLIPYPDGIIPILLSGYPSTQSDSFIGEKNAAGYEILANNTIPYSEVIKEAPFIDLQEKIKNNITLIGSQKTVNTYSGTTYFDDYATQETNMMLLANDTNSQNVSYTGFMPDSLRYNLDTIQLLSNTNTSFVLSSQIESFTNKMYGKGQRDPQIAYIGSIPTGVVLLPVSYPMSGSLSFETFTEPIFSTWEGIIDGAADNDEMVLLLVRSNDIGDPLYSERFIRLFSYSKDKGLTFTTPARISDHFKQLQNIRYSGVIDGDTASLNVTNMNNATVRNVTFSVALPILKTGNYRTTNGDIVRIKQGNNQSVLYIRTEIPANATKNIIIEPDTPRKSLQVGIPQFPIEGLTEITVKDEMGNPLPNVDVLVDYTKYYQTDKNGVVHVELNRGYHRITVKNPGYEKFSSLIQVKGRVFIIPNMISSELSS